jgi:hypothetical protein
VSDNSVINRRFPPPLMPGAILCTIPQAAAVIGRGTSFIYEALGDGRIEVRKSDGRTLVLVESLRAYVASLPVAKIKPTPPRRSLKRLRTA